MSKVLAACLMLAAQTYNVPPAVMVGIYNVEGGKIGQQVSNTNGTYDLGPMQINTLWLPELAEYWGVNEVTARKWVRDDACTNMQVSAWILRQHLNETGSLAKAIAHYHSRTPERGSNYRRKVVSAMERQGLIRPAGSSTSSNGTRVTVRAQQSDRFGKQAQRSSPTTGFRVASTAGLRPDEAVTGARGMNSIVVHNPIDRSE